MLFPPEFIDPQTAKLGSKTHTQFNASHGGNGYVNQLGDPHIWTLDLTTPTLVYTQSMALYAFACSLEGRFKSFQLANPLPPLGHGIGSQSSARYVHMPGDNKVSIKNAPANQMGALQAGDFIQFLSHSKAYMITKPVNTNGVGETTVFFTPSLRQRIEVGTVIRTGSNVKFNLAMTTDKHGIMFDARKASEQKVVLTFEERLHD